MSQHDVTPEAIAKRRAEGKGPKKESGLSWEEKIQLVYGLVVVGLFTCAIFACSFLFKLVLTWRVVR